MQSGTIRIALICIQMRQQKAEVVRRWWRGRWASLVALRLHMFVFRRRARCRRPDVRRDDREFRYGRRNNFWSVRGHVSGPVIGHDLGSRLLGLGGNNHDLRGNDDRSGCYPLRVPQAQNKAPSYETADTQRSRPCRQTAAKRMRDGFRPLKRSRSIDDSSTSALQNAPRLE